MKSRTKIPNHNKLNIDAGNYNPYPKFGVSPRKITFGSKYKFKPDNNPAPGAYNPENSQKLTKPSSVMTPLFVKNVGKKIKKDCSPDAGYYEPHKKFGTTDKKMHFGSKYKFKADKNPCPGQYQPSDRITRANLPTFDWSK